MLKIVKIETWYITTEEKYLEKEETKTYCLIKVCKLLLSASETPTATILLSFIHANKEGETCKDLEDMAKESSRRD
jgi:hypothetical protein